LTREATIRQILVITDGCSNIGPDPVEAARRAHRHGIVVNVIGIVGRGDAGEQGYHEAHSIADAGGGMCRIVQPADISATAQMMTHQTMQMTLQQVVNQELLAVMGKSTEDLPPAERARVMQVVEKLEDEVALHLVVCLDTSASMRDKIPTVREAVRDLALSLKVRSGPLAVSVLAFPGKGEEATRLVQPFSSEVNVAALEAELVARGGTPTGPAIDHAADLLLSHARSAEEDGPRREFG